MEILEILWQIIVDDSDCFIDLVYLVFIMFMALPK